MSPLPDQQKYEGDYEIGSTGEPKLKLRAKTQIVVEGTIIFMGETFELPERAALGLVGEGEAEQYIEPDRPVDWEQNAPGPREAERGEEPTQGSRELPKNLGRMEKRQQYAAEQATLRQPQQDTTRTKGLPA